ncbi:MAG: DNA-binding protein, partial [Thermoleophilia bacterium]|nr:DNA-binding protein [Thermoleophilia bacterium]
EGGVLVDVAGLVRRPGVYRLPAGARVHQALAAAGGVRPGADLTRINRAAAVVDGQQVVVSPIAPVAPSGRGASAPAGVPTSGPVSLNSADVAALDALPGIGPVTAQHIVAEREKSGPFASVDDLDRVSGIGPATIEALREVVTP